MTALIHQQLELDPAVNKLSDTISQAKLRESNAERIGKLERQLSRIHCRTSSPLLFGINSQPPLTQQSRQHWDQRLCPLPHTMKVWSDILWGVELGGCETPQVRPRQHTPARVQENRDRKVRVPTKGALWKRPLPVGISSSSEQNAEQRFSRLVWGIECRIAIWTLPI
jgi:hypothetical protein